MAITDINISEQLETGAPSIKYTGKEGPRPSMQSQQEMMIAKQVWEAMGDEERGQFSNFQEFFRSGIWKQILQQAQQDEAQGIASLGPRNMEPNRMGAEYGGRIGFDNGGFTIDDAMAEEDRKVRESYKAYERYKASGGTKSYEEFMRMVGVGGLAQGGRIGYAGGGDMAYRLSELIKKFNAGTITSEEENEMEQLEIMLDYGRPGEAQGGRIGARLGGNMEELSMRETIDTPEGIETLKETENMKMAGPDWYIKRIEHLMYLGFGEDEAAEIAYDSDKYYEAVGHDPGE